MKHLLTKTDKKVKERTRKRVDYWLEKLLPETNWGKGVLKCIKFVENLL